MDYIIEKAWSIDSKTIQFKELKEAENNSTDYITSILKRYPKLKNILMWDMIHHSNEFSMSNLINYLEKQTFYIGQLDELIEAESNIKNLKMGKYNELQGCPPWCELCYAFEEEEIDDNLMCRMCRGLAANTNME